MTKQQLKERYKEIEAKKIADGITEVNLWKDKTHPFQLRVKILFAYDKLYFTGDFGTFVFGNYVHDIKTFFQGDKINPHYWMEKCEASSVSLLSEHIDLDECRKKLTDFLYDRLEQTEKNEGLEGFEKQDYEDTVLRDMEDTLDCLDDYYIPAARQIADFFKTTLEIDDYEAEDKARSIVHECRPFSEQYLYACEVIQWVENSLEKWMRAWKCRS